MVDLRTSLELPHVQHSALVRVESKEDVHRKRRELVRGHRRHVELLRSASAAGRPLRLFFLQSGFLLEPGVEPLGKGSGRSSVTHHQPGDAGLDLLVVLVVVEGALVGGLGGKSRWEPGQSIAHEQISSRNAYTSCSMADTTSRMGWCEVRGAWIGSGSISPSNLNATILVSRYFSASLRRPSAKKWSTGIGSASTGSTVIVTVLNPPERVPVCDRIRHLAIAKPPFSVPLSSSQKVYFEWRGTVFDDVNAGFILRLDPGRGCGRGPRAVQRVLKENAKNAKVERFLELLRGILDPTSSSTSRVGPTWTCSTCRSCT